MSWPGDDTFGCDANAFQSSPKPFGPDNDPQADTNLFTADGGDSWRAGDNGDAGFGGEEGAASGGNDACRNCGQTGHFARECPEPKKMKGECFNCGQVGHNKVDCPNPRVERPFTGTCRVCEKEGHRASECPEKPPTICRLCNKEGHRAMECSAARFDFIPEDAPTMAPAEAWEAMCKADKNKDIDDFKEKFWAYIKAMLVARPADGAEEIEVDSVDLESGFRNDGWNMHLIAKERELLPSQTLVGINGKPNQKYVLAFSWTPKARSKKLGQGWPSSPEKNLERLKDCGVVCKSLIPVCSKCDEKGHIAKHCKMGTDEDGAGSVAETTRIQIICVICNEVGHRARDCTNERLDPFACKNCKKPGHRASECPEPKSADGVKCKSCGEIGHFSRDCPTREPRSTACRNCGEEGHMAKECDRRVCCNCKEVGHVSRDCPQPKNPANSKCRNCDEVGHFSHDCPKPRDYSRVQCQNCGEKGHTRVRCKNEPGGGGDSWGNNDSGPANAWDDNVGSGGFGGGDGFGGDNDFGASNGFAAGGFDTSLTIGGGW